MKAIYSIAHKYWRRYPEHDYWHLAGAGWIGYCDAVRLYKPGKSSFKTFADRKIHFAISESLWFNTPYRTIDHKRRRKETWIPMMDFICIPQVDWDFDRKRRLRQILKKLPRRQRRIMHDIFFRGRPYDEIASKNKLTKTRIYQIRRETLHKLKIRLTID